MTFCYFVPDVQTQIWQTLDQIPESTGLRKVMRDREPNPDPDGKTARPAIGPGGRNGTLFSLLPVTPKSRADDKGEEFSPLEVELGCRFDEEQGLWLSANQRWLEVKKEDGSTNYFIGWNVDRKPGPPDLRRNVMVDGFPVKLNDGHEWMVPIVGPFGGKLPASYRLNAKGEEEASVKREFRKIFEWSERLNREWSESKSILRLELWRYAVALLAINYRVSETEAGADCLDLVTSEELVAVFEASVGISSWRAEDDLKKKPDDVAVAS